MLGWCFVGEGWAGLLDAGPEGDEVRGGCRGWGCGWRSGGRFEERRRVGGCRGRQ